MEIKVTLLPGRNYHKDLLIEVGNHEELTDTYYFWRDEFGKLKNPYEGIKKVISDYLGIWVSKLEKLKLNEQVFIPINFSDEFIGGFKVKGLIGSFDIVYGYIYDIQDQIVRVNEDECYTNFDDKPVDTLIKGEMPKEQFLRSFRLSF